jgi:pimeloyl-ACP methyl ester carboxylesterase
MEAIQSLFSLGWRRQQPKLRPLPEHIKRTYVSTPGGDLELLISKSKSGESSGPAIFFLHGGYGGAGVWLEWMNYIHESGYGGTLYAYSARNHGASYSVSYLKMVYGTSFEDIVGDFKACYQRAGKEEALENGSGGNIVLVGHSAGGGVAQYALSEGTPCRALCLVDAIPHFGAL